VLQDVLLNVAQNVQRDEPLITKYDTIAGDGDCGTTLLAGVNGATRPLHVALGDEAL
jgi:dihydroxyacetone kinase